MNKNLIFTLSLFGLAMAFATISLIPSKVEPIVWIIIFLFCAWTIAKKVKSNYFLHGFLVSIVNSVWITAVHIWFFGAYMNHHPEMNQMSSGMPLANHPRLMMLLTGPLFGAVCGLILGLLCILAAKMVGSSSQKASG